MRSAQRDQGGTVTFSATVFDAASGAGVAQPGGVPYTFTRTATGTYLIRFDARICLVSAVGSPHGGITTAVVENQSTTPTQITVYLFTANTGVAVNGQFKFSCTALDKRS